MDTTPLLSDTVEGAVDHKGGPAIRSKTGRWRSALFIIGVEVAERFSYCGIGGNLITYLTGPLQQSTVTATVNVNTWSGVASMLPLLGAFVADGYLGRYRTILFASLLYVLGLSLLTLSAVLPSFIPSSCDNNNNNSTSTTSCRPPQYQIIFFFSSLYIVALAQGGHKPCVQAFGADQFDGQHPEESKSKSSFFNWWFFGLFSGILCTNLILTYIQDNLNWGFGFGIPCVCMIVALAVFLLGTNTYRYSFSVDNDNPFRRIAQVFVSAAKNWRATPPTVVTVDDEEGGDQTLLLPGANQFRFLDKALMATASENSKKGWVVCSVNQVEEAKALLRLGPIWATCLVFAIVNIQSITLFTKQATTMDRKIGSSGFQIPPASLQTFISLSIVLFMPFYDRVLVPIARDFTKKPSGITMLQRIGTGIVLSMIAMVVAALVERERLQIAIEAKIVNIPEATVPMSVWWLVPQYILFGIADAFTRVGLQEFFYDQMPKDLRSVGLALFISVFGVGSFLSSFLISAIETLTGENKDSWFSNNLNRAHLDYFYWLLAGLSSLGFLFYLHFAKSYVYNRGYNI
ncbi:protein NRT1/ PTR FAMILY 5.10-like isoform X1 [Telopea speciosissima]|uniref:protein NRT1/ PTR FAMILY 5.10-like isoform X1 n=1 Tax=Telopea speciosissima TaxID=54955 RepID=UPI001CC673D0|nr:protein NRT1/ PTR FAMILY 5.10-like isoform X1 [Telopea speciosissima]